MVSRRHAPFRRVVSYNAVREMETLDCGHERSSPPSPIGTPRRCGDCQGQPAIQTATVETGSTDVPLTPDEARELTARIKLHAESLWALLLEAHDREAWKALGYGSWAAYIAGEFDMSRVHAYRLVDQGRAVREIEAAAGVTHGLHPIDISEREARDIKPHLPEVADEIQRRIEAERADPVIPGEPSPERVRQIVDETVQAYREPKREADDADRFWEAAQRREDAARRTIAMVGGHVASIKARQADQQQPRIAWNGRPLTPTLSVRGLHGRQLKLWIDCTPKEFIDAVLHEQRVVDGRNESNAVRLRVVELIQGTDLENCPTLRDVLDRLGIDPAELDLDKLPNAEVA